MKICIDPGHSGPVEPGACAGGVTEAEIVYVIAKFAKRFFSQFIKFIRVRCRQINSIFFLAKFSFDLPLKYEFTLECKFSDFQIQIIFHNLLKY